METDKTIEQMIESGELSVMTECAYGSTIADTESNNVLHKDTKKKDIDHKKETDETEI